MRPWFLRVHGVPLHGVGVFTYTGGVGEKGTSMAVGQNRGTLVGHKLTEWTTREVNLLVFRAPGFDPQPHYLSLSL